MTDVVLVYPYFRGRRDKSPFRFPPLGLGYIASFLRSHGFSVGLVDCTFISENEATERVRRLSPSIIGIYSMFSMKKSALRLSELLRDDCDLLVAGGPLPTLFPEDYLKHFDVACIGEGEQTMLELVQTQRSGGEFSNIRGICISAGSNSGKSTIRTQPRPSIQDLDSLPFPARDLFDNQLYQEYFKRRFNHKETSIITTRGCPFDCDFCSRAVFQNQFRARSSQNVVNELEEIAGLGYDWVWFSDDCFTLTRSRVLEMCNEMTGRGIDLKWECLSRVDTFDFETAKAMKKAGCERVFFGIESGDDGILREMKKRITTTQAKQAVHVAVKAGLKAAAFFIIGYPGESNSTILHTIRFATRLPLDYLSFSVPYPIPGTGLHEKVEKTIREQDPNRSRWSLSEHSLLYDSDFSEFKLKFGIAKAAAQHLLQRHVGRYGYALVGTPFEAVTDLIFERLR